MKVKRTPPNRRAGEAERAIARELVWRFRGQVSETLRTVDGCELEFHCTAETLCDALERFARFGTFAPTSAELLPETSGHRRLWARARFADLKRGGATPDQAIAFLAERAGVEFDTMRAMVYRKSTGGRKV